MFTFNKTSNWLNASIQQEEKGILETARKAVRRVKRESKEGHQKLENKRLNTFNKFQKEAARQKKLNKQLQQLTTLYIKVSFFQNEEQVDDALIGLTNAEMEDMLKAQVHEDSPRSKPN